jgi:hypothetical protein
MCGPQDKIRAQQIPGYTGYIAGVQPENVYSRSYANNTSLSISNQIKRGFDHNDKRDKYISQNSEAYSPYNFRRFVERPEIKPKRDYLEYSMVINNDEAQARDKILHSSIDHIEQSPKKYNDKTDTTFSPDGNHKRDLRHSMLGLRGATVQVKPVLLERGIA